MPEIIGTALFLAAVVLTTFKISSDFGKHGELGYVMLIILIGVYASAIGVVWMEPDVVHEAVSQCYRVEGGVLCSNVWA